jgi:hypothetical protein
MAITSWSHSKLVDFEKCKFLAYLKHDQKIPEPARPLPPGKTEQPNDRGSRLHTSCEDYVTGRSDELSPEVAKHFGPQLDLLRVLHDDGLVHVEGEWGFNDRWEPAEWNSAWLRMKLDALVFWSPQEATVIDYKSGKKYGNEIKHGEQVQLYQLATFLRYPKLETVHAELWYLDVNDVTTSTFTRDKGLSFKHRYDRRGRAITSCTSFPPASNVFSCQWCRYGDRPDGTGSGHCQKGVFR